MSPADEFRQLNTRKTSVLPVGGFRPTLDLTASRFGLAGGLDPLGLLGEEWPVWNSQLLLFVWLMNLATLPRFRRCLPGLI
jgi:hypothetical protein